MEKFHTKAPWNLRPNSRSVFHGDEIVAIVTAPRSVSDEKLPGESWLDMRERTMSERYGVDRERCANAALISAAPDLLQAALDFVEWFECGRVGERPRAELDAARAAITKATGQKS